MSTTTLPAPLASGEVDSRIAAERERLASERAAESDLLAKRLAPLESGDDAALDKIESQLVACRDRQKRIEERIAILERRGEEAREREHAVSLDRLALRAQRARERGERIIREEYRRHAEALAAALARLAAVEIVIHDVNRKLDDNGRPCIPSPNAIRCRPPEQWEETVTKRVHVNSPLHPDHDKVSWSTSSPEVATLLATGERISAWTEIQVVEQRSESPDWALPLTDVVFLPGVGPSTRGNSVPDLWNVNSRSAAHDAAEALAREIDAELDGGTLGKIGRAASRALGMGDRK